MAMLQLFLCCNAFAKDHFQLFDEIGQSGKPSLIKFNIQPFRSVPAKELWRKGQKDLSFPDYNYISTIADSARFSGSMICLDIEHWDLHDIDQQKITEHIGYLGKIAQLIKAAHPQALVGYYGVLPIRNYYAPIKNNPADLQQWHQKNSNLKELADRVDVIFPSLYTFKDDPEAWQKYAIANIEQARQYNKPVIVYLWPQYHGSNKILGYKFVDGKFWRMQLETVYQHADGAVIWTPWGKHKTKWDGTAEWVIETQKFAQEKLITHNQSSINISITKK